MLVLSFLIAVVLCFGILYIPWLIEKHWRITRMMRASFPSPNIKFFVGTAGDFVGKKGMLEVFKEYLDKYGDIVYARIGPTIHTVIFCNADLAKEVFHASFNLTKGHSYEFTKRWLGHGLLTTKEHKWRKQRDLCRPAFDYHLLMDYVTLYNKHAEVLVQKLNDLAPTNSINIHPLLSLCSLDIICETSMDVQMNAQENQNTEYVTAVKEMCRIIAARSCSLFKANDYYHLFTKDYRIERKCVKILHDYTEKVIEQKRETRAKRKEEQRKNPKKKTTEDEEGVRHRHPPSLLDLLLDHSEKSPLTENEIKDEVHTFMFAGHDTVTAAMSFFLYEIAKHPEVQKELFEEQQVFSEGDLTKPVDWKETRAMDLLSIAIKETMRLYPPVPVYTRKVTQEFTYNGNLIPKGVTLTFFAYGLHRNPKYYDDPDTFQFRRFKKNPKANSYLPFSVGPRSCIGLNFAQSEMMVILAHLIRNFEFKPAEPEHVLDLRSEVVLTSKNGINMKVIKRDSKLFNLQRCE